MNAPRSDVRRRRELQGRGLWAARVGVLIGGVVAGVAAPTAHGVAAGAGATVDISTKDVQFVAVSPVYQRTGLVVAGGNDNQHCTALDRCHHIWVSHDGGESWVQSASKGWNHKQVYIAVDSRGHEVLFAASDEPLDRSDDEGETWKVVTDQESNPFIPAEFASNGLVAVGGSAPYLYSNLDGSERIVDGSGGKLEDLSLMLAPSYPVAGSFAPALLEGRDGSRHEVVQQCDAQIHCTGGVDLP